MAKLLPPIDPSAPPTPSAQELQAEIERLRRTLREANQEKDRALRLLRQTNTDLAQQVQGKTRQLSSLNHLINKINGSLDLQEVAATALNGLRGLIEVEATSLALRDSTDEIKYVLAQPAQFMPVLTQLGLKKGQGIVGRVIETGRPYVVEDTQHDPLFTAEADHASGFEARSVLCEPLIVHDQVIGAVQLINKHSGPFTGPERAFVETVAGSLAIAIENARMYEELQARLKELEHKNEALVQTQAQLVRSAKLASIGELTAGLAHEINNPVGIILGFSQLIGQQAGSEKVKSFAGFVERESMRIKRIVGDLLAFARPTPTEVARADLRQVVEKALGLLEYQLTTDRIRISRAFADEPAWAMVDGDQITQVLMNLIQNARQAMPGGGELTLRVGSEGAHSFFAVADTGAGIDEADLDQIFDPFFTTKPEGQGTGLGLSVSYGIITRHGGDIRVASQPGAGTTFTVRLPAAAGEAALQPAH